MARPARWMIAVAATLSLVAPVDAVAAAYDPSLVVSSARHSLGARTGIGLALDSGECCHAPGRITMYAPPGYGVRLDHPVGSDVGGGTAAIRIGSLEQLALVDIRTESPAVHVHNSCAPGIHDAVWILEFQSAPYRFRVPMYVDRVASGPEATFATVRMVMCFASPYVPPPTGAPEGIAVSGFSLGILEVFTNPAAAGSYAWNTIAVAYRPGTGTLDPALGAQSTSYVRLPVTFSVTVKRARPGSRKFVVTVCIRESGVGVAGVRVMVMGRPRPSAAFTRYVNARTGAGGCITRRFRPRERTILGQVWTYPLRRAAPGCSPALAARCSRPTISSWYFQRALRIRR